MFYFGNWSQSSCFVFSDDWRKLYSSAQWWQCNSNSAAIEHKTTILAAILGHIHIQSPPILSQRQFRAEYLSAGDLYSAVKTSVPPVSWNGTLTISYFLRTLACQMQWLQKRLTCSAEDKWLLIFHVIQTKDTVSSGAVKYCHQWSFTVCRCRKTTLFFLAISPSVLKRRFVPISSGITASNSP